MNNYFNTQIGFGTANLGNTRQPDIWNSDLDAMLYAIEVGYKMFDTAEMYGDGKTETMLGFAMKIMQSRSKLHVVSKVLPKNATTKESVIASCEKSIQRMQCDYIDTYLLHWREGQDMPLEPVVEAFAELKQRGLIKNYGVSSFSKRWIEEWQGIEQQRGIESTIVTNQIRYHLEQRDAERYYLDWQHQQGITTMAFSPLGNGSIFKNMDFVDVAQRYGYLPAQLAIAWAIRNPMVTAIPKSSKKDRIKKNFDAQSIELSPEILAELEKKFPL